MNQLSKVFNYEGRNVRTVTKDGELWFVAKDVCDVLEINNPSQALTRLDGDEKNTIILNEGIGNPEKSIISESGLYALVMSSKKEEAQNFKRWIRKEVLPSIRKTGSYQIPDGLSPQMQLTAELFKNAIEVDRKINEVKADVDKMEQRINTSIATLTEEVKKDWKDTINSKINELCARCSFNYQTFRAELYGELEKVANCNLGIRQKKLRERLEKGGATYKERQSITKIHVIEKDNNLKQLFEGIVNTYILKYSD